MFCKNKHQACRVCHLLIERGFERLIPVEIYHSTGYYVGDDTGKYYYRTLLDRYEKFVFCSVHVPDCDKLVCLDGHYTMYKQVPVSWENLGKWNPEV